MTITYNNPDDIYESQVGEITGYDISTGIKIKDNPLITLHYKSPNKYNNYFRLNITSYNDILYYDILDDILEYIKQTDFKKIKKLLIQIPELKLYLI